jgi:hypothetical protein
MSEHGDYAPNAALRSLDRLVGTWEQSGGVQGTVTYEWLEGGYFLLQHVDLLSDGRSIKGLEVIGHERPFMGEPSADIKSRFYSNTGDTLDYVYELEGDTLTIWGGERGSLAYYRGTFGPDGDTLTGAWHYPGSRGGTMRPQGRSTEGSASQGGQRGHPWARVQRHRSRGCMDGAAHNGHPGQSQRCRPAVGAVRTSPLYMLHGARL